MIKSKNEESNLDYSRLHKNVHFFEIVPLAEEVYLNEKQ
jgi:hypothetical protein